MTSSFLSSIHPLVKWNTALGQLIITMMQVAPRKRQVFLTTRSLVKPVPLEVSACHHIHNSRLLWKSLPWRPHSQTSTLRSESASFSFSKPKRSNRLASSGLQICAIKTEISLPGQKPSSALFRRPSTAAGTPWRGPEPAGEQAARWWGRKTAGTALPRTAGHCPKEEDTGWEDPPQSTSVGEMRRHLSYLITISVFLIFWQWINNFCKSLCASDIWFWACSTIAFLTEKQSKREWLCWGFARVISIVTVKIRTPISSIRL